MLIWCIDRVYCYIVLTGYAILYQEIFDQSYGCEGDDDTPLGHRGGHSDEVSALRPEQSERGGVKRGGLITRGGRNKEGEGGGREGVTGVDSVCVGVEGDAGQRGW